MPCQTGEKVLQMSGSKLLPEEWSVHKPTVTPLIRINGSSNPGDTCEKARRCDNGFEREGKSIDGRGGRPSTLFRWAVGFWRFHLQGDVTEHQEAFFHTGRMCNKWDYIRCVAVHAKFSIVESERRHSDFCQCEECSQQYADGCTVWMTPPVDSGLGARMPVIT